MTPVVGITSYLEDVRFGVWDAPAALVPAAYVRALERAGARPVILPPSEHGVGETLARLDGLLLAGGSDIDPSLYGAEPHAETSGTRPERDLAELALLEGALERDLPVLGICRGSEILNVGLGGTLAQHLPDLLGSERHRHTPGAYSDHGVRFDAGSRLGAALGERAEVKSHHHQGYDRLGAELRPVAWADDGTVEGLEHADRRFALGVLWHPEEGEDAALFAAFVAAAAAYRASAAQPGMLSTILPS